MKSVLFRASLVLGLGLALGWVKAGHAESEMIEVGDSADQSLGLGAGVGFASLGGDHYAEVMLRLQFDGVKISDRFVLARFRADMAAGAGGVSYVDVDFKALEIGDSVEFLTGSGDSQVKYSGWISVGGLDVQRNLALGNNMLVRISALGVRGDWERQVSANFQFFASTAADFFAMGIVPVAGDLRSMSTVGLSAKIGAVIANRFKIALGEKFDSYSVIDDRKYLGTSCSSYYVSGPDDYGPGAGHGSSYIGYTGPGMYSDCQEAYQEINGEHRLNSKTYLELVYEISKHFSAFGSANFVVYKAYNVRNAEENVEQNAYGLQVMFGVQSQW
ncbi:hypothetical protein WDW86_22535 [Bdellovibrionota bacterium FG-2]